MRGLYVGLAIAGEISMEEAMEFSSKSLRCGGVSQAAAEAIRDGVTQAHGGWLIRQSLVHHDLAKSGFDNTDTRFIGDVGEL